MAATIKPIEAKSVHQIQSGQVIVDLCSVVKELVENALDAGANTIEVRFDNYGLDKITVQDNGTGIAEANYEAIALKHHTSKLSNYNDLSSLETFGFRGEALSSLCALSTFTITTAQAHEAPKGTKLEFEISGKLKSSTFVAAQKGTTACVEHLFSRLPVRQKELSKNIKREYGKVVGLLHAYACISTGVKFTVKNSTPKSKTVVVFSTKGNGSTRENIANVYGAKMLAQLIELDLKLDYPSALPQLDQTDGHHLAVTMRGHISKPTFGEGRQTPDRQMFFVNGRPCGLPQIAKAINEVYKSFNVSQSPFIFADFQMDTNAYDVNVSPDKRTIFLHDATALTNRLKAVLTAHFDQVDQTVPQSQFRASKLPAFRQLSIARGESAETATSVIPNISRPDSAPLLLPSDSVDQDELAEENSNYQVEQESVSVHKECSKGITTSGDDLSIAYHALETNQRREAIEVHAEDNEEAGKRNEQSSYVIGSHDVVHAMKTAFTSTNRAERANETGTQVSDPKEQVKEHVTWDGAHFAGVNAELGDDHTSTTPAEMKGAVESAFDRMRARMNSPQMATIRIGHKVITKMIGTQKTRQSSSKADSPETQAMRDKDADHIISLFSQRLSRSGPEDGMAGYEQKRGTAYHDDTVSYPTRLERSASHENSYNGSDEDQVRADEAGRVQELIELAEQSARLTKREQQQRKVSVLKASLHKDNVNNVVACLDVDLDFLAQISREQDRTTSTTDRPDRWRLIKQESACSSEEERLSLTIHKSDFRHMHIAGQFNLGFIIAVRWGSKLDKGRRKDELFIVDQHASDEKYNFERLQAQTTLGNQRLVHPIKLELTAVEEEIVLENTTALEHNGFLVETDLSGDQPVGQRCQLVSLPLSKEVTFNEKDFEELIHLLSEAQITTESSVIPRPSKVRKMFAMRACRSSIMIGRILSHKQMSRVLGHMGTIDKPWNCPHGRPTMRHLISLDDIEAHLWQEGDGLVEDGIDRTAKDIWQSFLT